MQKDTSHVLSTKYGRSMVNMLVPQPGEINMFLLMSFKVYTEASPK